MDDIDGIPEDAPQIRLCHIKKRSDFNGYGFNLHAEKSKPGQFIGTVDEGSPAERAGLQEGDRIVEVNDVNICHENHKQVVARIKVISDETKLLVVDKETEDYYRNKEIVIRRDLPTVVLITSDDDNDYVQPPNNNNYMAENERRSSKNLGNVCHQSFAVEDEDSNEINYAMQRTDNHPPPLPNSAPPISDEDDEDIKHERDDRDSLGGSSYDKQPYRKRVMQSNEAGKIDTLTVDWLNIWKHPKKQPRMSRNIENKLDTDGDLLPPPPNEDELLIKEDEIEAKDTANKIVVTATIESSSEDGDDQQEEGINSRSNSINELPESKKPKDVEQRRIGHTSMDDNEPMLVQQYPNDDGNEGINADSLIRKESVDIVSHKDECLETKSNSSESIPDALDEPPKLNLEASEGQLNKDEEETTSDQSIPADTQFEEMTKDAKVEEINSTEAVEWNMKMANMGSSADTRSLSTASLKNDDEAENVIKEHQDPVSGVEMVVTTDTLVSKENVKIEVTRRRKKTEPASFESFDSVDDNPPMPAPRTETPVSEKSSTASMEESGPRSFSPSSMEHSISLPSNTNDVVDASSSNRGRNWDGLNLNMTAAEMRERIGSKKKRDPRKEDRMDFRTKYEMIQAL